MPQIILNILEFLKRTPLKGDEVPAYNEAVNFLNDLLKPKEKIDNENDSHIL